MPSDNKNLLARRTYAFTTDLLLVLMINKAITLSYTNFIKTVFYQLSTATQMKIINSYDYVTLATLWTVFWSYFVVSYYLGEGKTVGKIFFGIQVFSKKCKEGLSFNESLLRTLAHFLCLASGCMLFTLPFLREDRKSLGDLFCDTWVGLESKEERNKPVLELVPVSEVSIEEKKAA